MRALATTIFAMALCASPALAQDAVPDRDAEAHALFEAGRLAFSAGHYEDAYDRFSQAYLLSERPELLFNLGAAADRLRRDAQALDHYRAYLAAVPDSPERANVEHRIAILDGSAHDDEPTVAVATPPTPTPAPAPAPAETPIWEQWWLWTIIGAVVIGGAIGIAVAVSTPPSTASPSPGDVGPGGVVLTLTTPF